MHTTRNIRRLATGFLILFAFLAELMDPMSPFVRVEPTPAFKSVVMEHTNPSAPQPDDEQDDDETGVIHSHSGIALEERHPYHALQVIREIEYVTVNLEADGVVFPTIHPPTAA